MSLLKYTYEEFRDLCDERWSIWDDVHTVSWSLGGSYGNCWDETMHYVGPDDEPEDTILDEILETFVPELSFLEYRKIRSSGIYDTKTSVDHDYYGGQTTECTRTLDLKALYEQIKYRL